MKPAYAEAAALMEMAGVNGENVWTVVKAYCMFSASLYGQDELIDSDIINQPIK